MTLNQDRILRVLQSLEWCGEDYKFITWGGSDLTEFREYEVFYGKLFLFH